MIATDELFGFGRVLVWAGPSTGAIRAQLDPVLARARPDHHPTVVDRDLGYFANLSVRDNLLLGLQPAFNPAVKTQLVETAELVGLDLKSLAGRLDRQQQSKVCLARAFVANPTIMVIVDPPTIIDDAAREGFARLVQARRRRGTLTIIALTMHDPASFELANLVVVQQPGERLVFTGNPIKARLAELIFSASSQDRRATLGRMAAEMTSAARSMDDLAEGLVGLLGDINPNRSVGVAIQGPNLSSAVAQVNGPPGRATIDLERWLSTYPEPLKTDPRFRQAFELGRLGPDRDISGLVALERCAEPRLVSLDEATSAIWPALAGFGARQRQEFIQRDRARIDAIDSLVGGIAHDLNNSLQSVVGAAEVVAQSIESAEVAPLVDTLRASAADATAFVTKLLAFSRETDPEATVIDMHQVIGDAVDIVRRGTARSLQAQLDLNARWSGVIGKAPALRNVMVNLLINAAQATEEAAPEVMISTGNTPSGSGPDQIVIDITDRGHGISATDADRLFEPFVSRQGQSMTTGLGLVVASSIVAEHQGHIELLETSSSGSTFRIQLPCCEIHGAAPQLESEQHDEPGNLGILVVDDDPLVLEVLTEMLHHQGHTCWQAPSGEIGLETLAGARSEIDICIVDQLMPGLTGDQVLLRIRQDSPEIGTIWLSGHHGPRGAIDQTAADVRLSKPVDLYQLTSAIDAARRRASIRSRR